MNTCITGTVYLLMQVRKDWKIQDHYYVPARSNKRRDCQDQASSPVISFRGVASAWLAHCIWHAPQIRHDGGPGPWDQGRSSRSHRTRDFNAGPRGMRSSLRPQRSGFSAANVALDLACPFLASSLGSFPILLALTQISGLVHSSDTPLRWPMIYSLGLGFDMSGLRGPQRCHMDR